MSTILNDLGTSQPEDEHDLALKRERLVLDIRLKHLPMSRPLLATTHATLSAVYSYRSEFKEAVIHVNEGLRIQLKYLPSGHATIVQTHRTIALLYLYQGTYEVGEGQKKATRNLWG